MIRSSISMLFGFFDVDGWFGGSFVWWPPSFFESSSCPLRLSFPCSYWASFACRALISLSFSEDMSSWAPKLVLLFLREMLAMLPFLGSREVRLLGREPLNISRYVVLFTWWLSTSLPRTRGWVSHSFTSVWWVPS